MCSDTSGSVSHKSTNSLFAPLFSNCTPPCVCMCVCMLWVTSQHLPRIWISPQQIEPCSQADVMCFVRICFLLKKNLAVCFVLFRFSWLYLYVIFIKYLQQPQIQMSCCPLALLSSLIMLLVCFLVYLWHLWHWCISCIISSGIFSRLQLHCTNTVGIIYSHHEFGPTLLILYINTKKWVPH